MKIGILTFHCAVNYGAVMQTYGLQEYLKSLGHDVCVLDYRPRYLIDSYRVFHLHWMPSPAKICSYLRCLLFRTLVIPIRYKRQKRFYAFGEKNLNLIPFGISESSNKLDVYVFGSDQIWNPQITGGKFDKVFMGCFERSKNAKLIAYAASVGNLRNIENLKLDLVDSLSAFDAIGVRERNFEDFLRPIMPYVPIQTVCDPVLLAGVEIFSKFNTKLNIPPFVLSFMLQADKSVIDIAAMEAQSKSIEIKIMYSSSESLRDLSVVDSATPEQFISYISNSSFVVTSSYHGCVFSILFQKQFVVVSKNYSDRFITLLQELGLEDRMVNSLEEYKSRQKELSKLIDYTSVSIKLDSFRRNSRKFLQSALND